MLAIQIRETILADVENWGTLQQKPGVGTVSTPGSGLQWNSIQGFKL